MSESRPSIVILAGPNGAGKSTVAPDVLQGTLAVGEFVNADVIASGLSAFDLFFLWLSSADLAVERVAERVASGGHNVPADTIRRRYRAGIRNFFHLYQPIVTSWTLYNASGPEPMLVAESLESEPMKVYDRGVWAAVQRQANE